MQGFKLLLNPQVASALGLSPSTWLMFFIFGCALTGHLSFLGYRLTWSTELGYAAKPLRLCS